MRALVAIALLALGLAACERYIDLDPPTDATGAGIDGVGGDAGSDGGAGVDGGLGPDGGSFVDAI